MSSTLSKSNRNSFKLGYSIRELETRLGLYYCTRLSYFLRTCLPVSEETCLNYERADDMHVARKSASAPRFCRLLHPLNHEVRPLSTAHISKQVPCPENDGADWPLAEQLQEPETVEYRSQRWTCHSKEHNCCLKDRTCHLVETKLWDILDH